MKQLEVAQLLIQKLEEYDKKYYQLCAYCIMPNHVHLLLGFSVQLYDQQEQLISGQVLQYTGLHKALQLIKGGSAYLIN